jgi:tryptophan 2,3-dioxygenase
MELTPEIVERIKQLDEKYGAMGQDMMSYLDGLLYADYLTYWDYINLDTLLSLQNPKTSFPDESIFIIYHQITELYFKLCLHEFEQIAYQKKRDADFFLARVTRINRYFEALTKSFDIMVDGMEKEQFLKFRMSLLPASGFQSGQYRMVEICSADFVNLVKKEKRSKFSGTVTDSMIDEMFEHIYWKQGATELATGKKTLTLKQFEEKYSRSLINLAKEYKGKNLWQSYLALSKEDQKRADIIEAMQQNDVNVNVNWPLVHYKSAVRYLHRAPDDIAATGGTNWQKYLPPRFQKRIFYPQLWSKTQVEEWGKGWVEEVIFEQKSNG